MTFNTAISISAYFSEVLVLNLVINGWPSIQYLTGFFIDDCVYVLNLVINGWPSIQRFWKRT